MARDSTGKWVQRAGATGGGRTYRGQVPVNWYIALAVIVVVGLFSVAFARHEYRSNPASATSKVQPTVGTTWFSGMASSICGTSQPELAASPSTDPAGITTTGGGVVKIAPKTSAQAGHHATLGQFVDGYAGLRLTADELQLPKGKAYTNGEKCPAGTPDAGKTGVVTVAYWPHATVSGKGAVVKGNPQALKLGQNSLFTIGFAPAGTVLPRPPESVVLAVLQAGSGATTSTSTPTATTPSTAPSTPTSSATTPSTAPTTTPSKAVTPTTGAVTPTTSGTSPTTAAK